MSTFCGKNAAANVLSDGTVNPKPTPRQPVATQQDDVRERHVR